MPSNKKLLQAAAGSAGGDPLYVEDVFSTFLYTGTGAVKTITNGIDLDGEGGVVWIKQRSGTEKHVLAYDENKFVSSNTTDAVTTNVNYVQSFNSNGFQVGAASPVNTNSSTFVSWTFRKAEKFFDIVTYTGNGASDRLLAHNLGAAPGMVFIKSTSATANWSVYHVGLGPSAYLLLNSTAAYSLNGFSRTVSSTEYELGPNWPDENQNGREYVAYFFGNAVGGFGDDGNENIIKCGDFTKGSSGFQSVELGFEPQFVLTKRIDAIGIWNMGDIMRGIVTGGDDGRLQAQSADSEYTENFAEVHATGFSLNDAAGTYVYMAIRRPMKTPTAGTEVFQSLAYTGDGASTRNFDLNLTLDAYFQACRSSASYDFKNFTARLTGKGLYTAGTGAEFITNTSLDVQDGLRAIGFENTLNQSGQTYIINGLKRAAGFMDVVAYSGTGVAGRTVAHNLGVAPAWMVIKCRNYARNWCTYNISLGNGYQIILNSSGAKESTALWNSTTPTATQFTLNNDGDVNGSPSSSFGNSYIAYLFATLAGVSKVGTYTGTGADLNVDCDFTGGARFILIKRTDSAGDWYTYDSLRGIVAGNDPYLLLNSSAAEVTNTDYIDPLNAGFTVTSNASSTINVNGGTYIFLAIA